MSVSDTSSIEPIGAIAHFNLHEVLPPSGPGELFRARDTIRGRAVIVRRFSPVFASLRVRHTIEEAAKALSQISHPNVIRLFEVGDDGGRLFMVFEHVKGQSLRSELMGRPMRVRRAVRLAVQIADAVADAHAAGYLHGGLSPDSVVITAKGHAKIPAHELACREGFDASVDPPRLRDYPSPEEVAGRAPDERSDVFSIGDMLYEMLTASRPSHRGAAYASTLNRHVPRALDEVLHRAIAPNPDRRHESVAALVRDLRSIDAHLDETGSPDDEDYAQTQPARTGRALLVAGVVLLGLVALAWWFIE